MTINIKILFHDKKLIPEYATSGSSGLDLRADIKFPLTLFAFQRALIPTGIALAIPVGYEAQIRSRSGLALNNGIIVLNSPGTIDSDFRGEIKVILLNISNEPFTVHPFDRIAQIVFAPVVKVQFVFNNYNFHDTSRDISGFGSSGML